ncbi:TrkH family potassium uptake protein [Spiroplasma endosymbiont of Polydrusus pterygomalis]|uniref:TrkH family potassium uptake protein n=1 Tax=Spiroplasma endosymbiont of Polydrusus pterygomalis TaxID=3139327 RepID=UPI003CCAB3B0
MVFFQLYFKNIFKRKSDSQRQRNNDPSAPLIRRRHWLPFSKISGRLFLVYILIVFFGGLLLSIPGVVNGSRTVFDRKGDIIGHYDFGWNYLVGLFTASSAFSDTGITISNPAVDYSFWGQLIILILIQTGGFGIVTFKIMIFVWLGRRISIKDKMLVQGERGSSNFGHTIDLIKNSFIFLIILECFGAILLFCNFYFSELSIEGKYMIDNVTYHNFWRSLWSGVFHSISSINNAGFDIIGNSSLMPYNSNYFIQFVFLFQFIIGGLGFPTFYDLKRKFMAWLLKEHAKFTLFTKSNLITYVGLSIVGVFSVWLIEFTNINTLSIQGGYIESILRNSTSNWNGFMNIFFNTMSTRNAGYLTVDMGQFLPGVRIVMSIMMFIGSAPSSTAGGIRTTTLAVIIITIWSIIRNNNSVNVFKRKIPNETVKRALGVTVISGALIAIAVICISSENPNLDFLNIFFTICSAFGTTGLNTLGFKDIYNFGVLSTLILILLMFIGQLGVSSTLLVSIRGSGEKEYSYVEENILIG